MYATKTVSSQTTSAWIPMDDNQAAFNASVTVTVSGTLTYSVEFTLDNVQDPAITPTAFSTALTGATTSQSLAVHYPVKAFRLNVTAFTSGSAIITVLQGSSWDGAATVGNSLLGELAAVYRPAPFPNFTPRLLAALVASSTAACTSGVVTITATAHGIPATSFDGYSFYYPGSPSLAAAWYTGFSRTGADTVTFSAPSSANFTSESVNGGAVLTTEVTVSSVVIPGGSILPGNIVSCRTARIADALTGSRILILRINGTQICRYNVSSTAINGTFLLSFCAPSLTTQEGFSMSDGILHATKYNSTVDLSQDMTLSVTHSLSVASQYIGIISLSLRIE